MGRAWSDDDPDGGCTCGAEPPAYLSPDTGDADRADPPDETSGELGRPQSGRWVRRGRKIVIMGA